MKNIEMPDKIQEEILRKMPGEKRMQIGFEICDFALKLVIAGIRFHFPNILDEELKEKIKERYRV